MSEILIEGRSITLDEDGYLQQLTDWSPVVAEALAARARHVADAGDVVLVKGSKGIRVSLVVDALRKLGQPGAAEIRGAE